MVGLRIKGLALHRLIISLCEATQGQDVPFMDESKGRAEPSCLHLLLLDDIHVLINLKAVSNHLILIVLIVTKQTTNHIDISVKSLERFCLDGNLL